MDDNSNKKHSLLSVLNPFEVFRHHETVEKQQSGNKPQKPKRFKFTTRRSFEAGVFLVIFFAFFGLLAYKMTLPNMLNTFMQTA